MSCPLCLHTGKENMNDIIVRIQKGEADLLPVLWDLCKDTIRAAARKRYRHSGGTGGVDRYGCEIDDYMNAAYIAVAECAAKYDTSGDVPFLAYLQMYFLRKEFQIAAGVRLPRQKEDAMHHAERFDDMAVDGMDIFDAIAGDDNTERAATDHVYQEGLRRHLIAMIDELPQAEAEEIRAAFFGKLSTQARADELDVTVDEIRRRRTSGLEHLRSIADHTRKGAALQRFVDTTTNFAAYVGVKQFQNTRTSAPEMLAIIRERRMQNGKD